MLGLNASALLRAQIGRKGGKPAYAEEGQTFLCRCEPLLRRSANGDGVEGSAQLRIFARAEEDFDPRPGDRVELDGKSCRIVEVRRFDGLWGVHHLEIEAREVANVHGR